MNAVLQVIMNLEEVKTTFYHPEFHKTINVRNKSGKQGKLMIEFLNIFKEKWFDEQIKTIIPRKFKEIIGEIKPELKGNDQQDAHDFMNFLLDVLHEEINLKSEKEYIANPEKYNGTDVELANEYWSNNLRRNFSFIHSFFLGQLKSKLICKGCNKFKDQYETFLSLSLPISQKKTISLNIILHRLPFTFKVYYKEVIEDSNGSEYNALLSNGNGENYRESLGLIRRKSLDFRLNESIDELIQNRDQQKEDLIRCENVFMKPKEKKDYLYTSKLATSIPLKISLEVDRKITVEAMMEKIRSLEDICLEKFPKFTELLIFEYREVINKKLLVDECFQNNQTIHVHEVLNSIGIDQLFNYKADLSQAIKFNELTAIHYNKGISTSEPYIKQGIYEK